MSVPIITPEKDPMGGVLLLIPIFQPPVERGRPGIPCQHRHLARADHPARAEDDSLELKGEQTKQALDVAQERIAGPRTRKRRNCSSKWKR
jgi:hypothetical protein